MSIGKITLLALVAGGLGYYQYHRDIETVRGEQLEAQKSLAEIQGALKSKQAEVTGAKKAIADQADKLKQAKTELEQGIASLEKEKGQLDQEYAAAIQQVRSATVGMRWPMLSLTDGRTLVEPVVRAVGDSTVEVAYNGGSEQLTADKLPVELQERLKFTPAAQVTDTAPGVSVVGLEISIRKLQKTRESLYKTKDVYMRQATDYRKKDAFNRQYGRPVLYSKVIPKVEASVFDLARQISQVNVEISNLEIKLATIKSGTGVSS